MDRGQDQVVLIKQWNAGLVNRGVRRIERKLGQEALARRIAGRNLFKLNQISATNFRVLMDPFEMWIVPDAGKLEICRPCGLADVSDHLNERGPVGTGARWGGKVAQRAYWVGGLRDSVEHTLC